METMRQKWFYHVCDSPGCKGRAVKVASWKVRDIVTHRAATRATLRRGPLGPLVRARGRGVIRLSNRTL